ncbi:hypothetical protein D3P09_11105 [Paenibacillus pinisoli]|uniref:S-layer homology domain-containing protein n=2 Tax=Paenibacillus pinisoli TaxID=1276110 RepID=A0A3A6PI08_9BACL|nr:hypothetical protein D3P09_11105 [Paenibacillus pinisoli]
MIWLVIASMIAVNGFGYWDVITYAEKAPLTDIAGSYSHNEITALVEAGIMTGYGDGSFKPASSITRAEFSAVIAKLLGLQEMPDKAAVFTDVDTSAWYIGYVGALSNAGIINGTAPGIFDPQASITREELAALFVRALGLEEIALKLPLEETYADSEFVSDWAKPYTALANRIGLIRGIIDRDGTMTIQPKEKAQRQAAARLAYEFMTNHEVYFNEAQRLMQLPASPSPEPSAAPSASPSSEPTATPSATPAPTWAPSPTATPVPTRTPSPTATPTISPTPTPTPTPIPTPQPPTGLIAASGDTVVTLTWEASAAALFYTVYQSTVSGTAFEEAATHVTATTATLTGLSNGTPYYFVVRAVNAGGESEFSAETSATPQVAAPVAPVLNEAVSGDMQVTLSWTAVPKATSYIVYYSIIQGTQYVEVARNITSTTATITELANGRTYYFVVRAVNAGGESSYSNSLSAAPVLPPPDTPANIRVTNGYQQATVQWNASARAARYNVYMSTVSGSEYSLVASNVAGTNYTVTNLTSGIPYYIVVRAINTAGESAPSAEANAMSYLEAPRGNSHYNYVSDMMLFWSKPANATRVKVFWSTTSDGPYTEYLPQYSFNTSVAFRPVVNGTTYYIKYIAVYPDGESDFSSVYTAPYYY